MTDDSFKLADTLWTKGASAREGALVLFQEAQARAKHETKPEHKVSQYVHSGPLSTPIYLLTGTAFELLLKAGVILAGGKASNSYLRNTIGHNLETALRECLTCPQESGPF